MKINEIKNGLQNIKDIFEKRQQDFINQLAEKGLSFDEFEELVKEYKYLFNK